jgi:septal ring factor EnvC (AmiA/AmiB activator)
MTLNDFIARAVSFFEKAEAKENRLNDEQSKALADLRSKNTEQSERLTSLSAEIEDLKSKLEKAQAEVNSKGAEVAKLSVDLDAEKKRTADALAGMGVDPKTIPAAPVASKTGDILAQYEAITNPSERSEFYRKHQAEYDAAWRKSHQ